MRTLYLDCSMGCAGDMLMAALLEVHPDREGALRKINAALGGRAAVTATADAKCGIRGTHVTVSINGAVEGAGGNAHAHDHPHTSVNQLIAFIDGADVAQSVRDDARAVYALIAGAEARVHGERVDNIHLHELGSLDALADVLGVCLLMHELEIGEVYASPVNVGGGHVKCAHGILPVPAPAAELLLRGVPIYSSGADGELCTPTGAALLRHFVRDYIPMPPMRVEAAGRGTGTKDFDRANILTAYLGAADAPEDEVYELSCNIDDMTPEALGYAMDALFAQGALDVYFTAIGMKKSRPGVMLTCLCRAEEREGIISCIFKNTTTLGLREARTQRRTLTRRITRAATEYGEVRVKVAEGYGVCRAKCEYDDAARLAAAHGVPLEKIQKAALNEYERRKG